MIFPSYSRRELEAMFIKEIKMRLWNEGWKRKLIIFICVLAVWIFSAPVWAESGPDRELTRVLFSGNQNEVSPEVDANPADGVFLGLGEVAQGGDSLKIDAAFPRFVDMGGDPLHVNIYVMVQMPSGYLSFLKPSGRFSPGIAVWRKDVDSVVDENVISTFPLINPITGEDTLEPGVYVFSTLVVRAETSEDLSDLDWDNDPMELTFYTVEVRPYWDKQ